MAIPTFYTPEEVASQLRVGRRTVYGWLSRGELRGTRVGHLWRITEADLRAFLSRRGRPEESDLR